jgi:Hemerythrin HHE cation binding domain
MARPANILVCFMTRLYLRPRPPSTRQRPWRARALHVSDDMPAFPSDLHAMLSEQHARIRGLLDDLDRLALGPVVASEHGVAVGLAALLSRLARIVAAHNASEEAALRPLLAQTDAWGPERVEAMIADHVAEHAALRAMIEPLHHLTDVERLRGSAAELAVRLRGHLDAEERTFLNPRVLRDDLVTVGEIG